MARLHCILSFEQISVDAAEVEFGSQVLGETRKRIISVTNSGALGTEFSFRKITGVCFKVILPGLSENDRGFSFERNCVLRRWGSETLK